MTKKPYKEIKMEEGPFAGMTMVFEVEPYERTVVCGNCGHELTAVFFIENPRPSDVCGGCPKCKANKWHWKGEN